MGGQSISVFFPVYNDEATIERIVNDTVSILESLNNDYEVIIVNDGSTDNTNQVLDRLRQKNNRIKVVQHLKNKGYGGALKAGFANSTKDLVFYTDSDGQYDVKELTLLLSSMEDGVDVVNGYKIQRLDSLYRIIIGKVYYWLVRLFFNLKLKDITCDFRIIRRSIFNKIQLESDSGAICVEMMKKIQDAGFVIVEIPVHHYPRQYGCSQFFTSTNVLKMILELVKLRLKKINRRLISDSLC